MKYEADIRDGTHYLFLERLFFDRKVVIDHCRLFNRGLVDCYVNKTITQKFGPEYDDHFKVLHLSTEPTVSYGRENADTVIQYAEHYDLIVTWDLSILDAIPHSTNLHYGSTWLNKCPDRHDDSLGVVDESYYQDLFDKSEYKASYLLSGSPSLVNVVRGYGLRVEVTRAILSNQQLGKRVSLYCGRGWKGEGCSRLIEGNKNRLFNYSHHITIENSRERGYFTEKIIDPMLTKTVPIYWGDPNIKDYFNEDGIIIIDSDSPEDFEKTILSLGDLKSDYNNRRDAIEDNYKKAVYYANYYERFLTTLEDHIGPICDRIDRNTEKETTNA